MRRREEIKGRVSVNERYEGERASVRGRTGREGGVVREVRNGRIKRECTGRRMEGREPRGEEKED